MIRVFYSGLLFISRVICDGFVCDVVWFCMKNVNSVYNSMRKVIVF